jgi:hypothetical protein
MKLNQYYLKIKSIVFQIDIFYQENMTKFQRRNEKSQEKKYFTTLT